MDTRDRNADLTAERTVAMKPVSLGPTGGGVAEVTNGLVPGEIIALDNFDKLQDGTRVAEHSAGSEATARSEP